MVEAVISLFVVLALTTVFASYSYQKFAPKWDEREDYGFKGRWKTPMVISVLVASVFTGIIALTAVNAVTSVILGILVFFLAATGLTDFKSHLVPKELSNLALIVGFIACWVGFITSQYYDPELLMNQQTQLSFQLIQSGLYMFAISGLFVVSMFVAGAVGFGDIKMFWATGLFMGSFLEIPQILAVFMGTFIVLGCQLVVKMVKEKSWKVSGNLPALPAFTIAYIFVVLGTNMLSLV